MSRSSAVRIGTVRRPARLLGAIIEPIPSIARSTRIRPGARSMSCQQSGEERSRIHKARSRSGSAARNACLFDPRDPLPPALDSRQAQLLAGRQRDQAILHRAPVDHAHRHKRIPDRARISALLEPGIDEPLNVSPRDVTNLACTERRQESQSQGRCIAADDRRLVDIAERVRTCHVPSRRSTHRRPRAGRSAGDARSSPSAPATTPCARQALASWRFENDLRCFAPRPPRGTNAS